jgi:predicted DNA-binding ribbon-helix-helix protein
MVTRAYNPSTQEVRQEYIEFQSSLRYTMTPYLKNKNKQKNMVRETRAT